MGQFVIAMSVTAMLSVVIKLGIGTVLVRDIARNHDRAPALVGSALILELIMAVPGVALIALYVHVLHFGSHQAELIWLATAVMLTAAISGVIASGLSGLEQMQYLAYASVIGNGLVSVAGIALVLAGYGLLALFWADLILTVLVLLLNLLWMRPYFRPLLRVDLAELRYLVTAGLPFWFGGLVFTTYLWIDSVILAAMTTPAEVGWYGVPTQIFSAILMVASVLGTAWFPRFAAAYTGGTGRLRAVARPALEIIVLLSLPIGAGTAVIARPLINMVYGPTFSGAIWVLVILGVTVIPTFLNMGVFQVLLASNRQYAWIRVVMVVTVINPLLNVALIGYFHSYHHNGAIGAALSLLGTEVIQAGCALALAPWLVERAFVLRLLRAGLATVGMSVLVYAVAGLGVAAQVAVGAMTFLVLSLVLRLPTPQELNQLRILSARLRRDGRAAARTG